MLVEIDEALIVTDFKTCRSRRMVQRVWQAIQGEYFYPAPSPLACPSCPFRAPCQ